MLSSAGCESQLQHGVLRSAKRPAGLDRLLRHAACALRYGAGVTQRRASGFHPPAFWLTPRVSPGGAEASETGATAPRVAGLLLVLAPAEATSRSPRPTATSRGDLLLPGAETAFSFVRHSIGSLQ